MREIRFSLREAPRPAPILGLSGLAPFLGLALAAALASGEEIQIADRARYLLGVWGGLILSFLGGCRWGFAAAGLGEGVSWWTLTVGVAPSLIGLVALGVGGREALWIAALGLIAAFAADVSLTRARGAPAWWPALRLPLTVVAALSLMAGALS